MELINILLQAFPQETSSPNNYSGLIMIIVITTIIILIVKRQKKDSKIQQQRNARIAAERKENEIEQEQIKLKEIEIKHQNVDNLQIQLTEILSLKMPQISELKNIISENESLILEKGGDNQLHLFIKIDSFLHDFKNRIVNDQKGLEKLIDLNWLKRRIVEESKRDGLEKIQENFNDMIAEIEGRKQTGFDSNIENFFKLGNSMKPAMKNQILTLEYYHSISVAMIVYYLSEKKIRYFEIYEAFEKLGVFDSTWQKNVLNKLDRIETRLSQLSNQLTELNRNFMTLVESSENIVTELKEINNSIMTNNLLQAITAYQTYKINKNTKFEIE